MGYAVQVDSGQVAAEGVGLVQVGAEVDEVSEALGRILLIVAGAGGGGALSQAAQAAAHRWSSALTEVAARGTSLGWATQQAARQYAEVEQLHTGVWAAGGGPRWVP